MAKKNKPTISYSELAATAKTGDIVLFEGVSLFSKLVRIFTGSRFSHIGMIYRHPEALLFFQATTLKTVRDVLKNGEKHEGVQLGPLKQVLDTYGNHKKGALHYRKFEVEVTDEQESAFKAYIDEVDGRPITSTPELFKEYLIEGRFLHHGTNHHYYFCSELVAESCMAMGFLPKRPISNSYSPRAFSDNAKKKLPWQSSGSLAGEHFVDLNS